MKDDCSAGHVMDDWWTKSATHTSSSSDVRVLTRLESVPSIIWHLVQKSEQLVQLNYVHMYIWS